MKTLTLILISIFLINCNEGGSGSASASSGSQSKLSGNFIVDDKSQLSPAARNLLDTVDILDQYFSDTMIDEGTGQRVKMYQDSEMIMALRLYANAFTQTADPQVVCDALVDLYADFGVDSEKIEMNGSPYAFIGGSSYCLVDVILPNGRVAVDPVLNRVFYGTTDFHSVADLVEHAENNTLEDNVTTTPNGFGMAGAAWGAVPPNVSTFHQSYEDEGFNRNDGIQDMYDFYHSMLNNLVE